MREDQAGSLQSKLVALSSQSPNGSLPVGGKQECIKDELKGVQIFDGAKIDFVHLPLLSKKTERHHDLLPLTPRHKRVRKENVFAWNSSEVPLSSGDLCGLRLMSNLKRRISDPSGHPEAEKRTRMEDESYLTPLPPISAPTPKDLSNSQVELSRLSFI